MAVNIYLKEPPQLIVTVKGSLRTISRARRRAKWLCRPLRVAGFEGNGIELLPRNVGLLVEVADKDIQERIDRQKAEAEGTGAGDKNPRRLVMPGMRFPGAH